SDWAGSVARRASDLTSGRRLLPRGRRAGDRGAARAVAISAEPLRAAAPSRTERGANGTGPTARSERLAAPVVYSPTRDGRGVCAHASGAVDPRRRSLGGRVVPGVSRVA